MNRAFRTSIRGACLALALAAPLAVTAADAPSSYNPNRGPQHYPPPPPVNPQTLTQKVHDATTRYVHLKNALYDHFVPGTPCVSGPNTGAMGVHFVLPDRMKDAVVEADAPEALIYEPQPDGSMRFVGVEFILDAAKWAAANPEGGAPSLEGHLMNYVGAPNRYGLDAFYELHVWAWEDNPEGTFADWNTRVTCEKQPLPN